MSHRLFFDTNVLLDHLLDREPFADDATELWSMAERREVVGLVAAISFNFVYYIVRHEAEERAARRAIKGLRDVFETVEVDAQIINQAIDSGFADFEDAIQHACAIRARATHLVTRDPAGFRRSEVSVVRPDAYLGTQADG
jgi:predicted nucleic acid-binding protein